MLKLKDGVRRSYGKKHQCTVLCILSGRGFKLSIFNTKSYQKVWIQAGFVWGKKDVLRIRSFLIDWLKLSHSCTIVICKVCWTQTSILFSSFSLQQVNEQHGWSLMIRHCNDFIGVISFTDVQRHQTCKTLQDLTLGTELENDKISLSFMIVFITYHR